METFITQVQAINKGSLTLSSSLVQAASLVTNDRIAKAVQFATRAHRGQMRKYTEVPYVTHTIAVASIVSLVTDDTAMIQAALLHDTVEDCDVTLDQVYSEFGGDVAELVDHLTDVEDKEAGRRAAEEFRASGEHELKGKALRRKLDRIARETTKAIDRMHTAQASPRAKTVKLADLIHNSFSIAEHDKDFARVYLPEKALLLDVLTDGDAALHMTATEVLKRSLAIAGGDRSAMASMGAFISAGD